MEENWQSFQNIINDCVEEHIPLKKLSSRYNLPWLNKSLQSGMKRKARLSKKAKNSNKSHHWAKYKHLKRSIQRGLCKAHWGYIDNTLTEALEKKDSKPFWRYVKAQRQELCSVSPLKQGGQLISDSKGKAEICLLL